MKEYSLLEVMVLLIDNPKLKFYRVGDKDFEVFKGHFGDLMYRIKGSKFARSLPIFNYTQDLFIKCE